MKWNHIDLRALGIQHQTHFLTFVCSFDTFHAFEFNFRPSTQNDFPKQEIVPDLLPLEFETFSDSEKWYKQTAVGHLKARQKQMT